MKSVQRDAVGVEHRPGQGLGAVLLYASLGTAIASLVILMVLVPAVAQVRASSDTLVQLPVYDLSPVPPQIPVPEQRPAAGDSPMKIAAWCLATLNQRAFDDDDAVLLLQLTYRMDSADARRVAVRFIGLSIGMHESTGRSHQYSRAMLGSLENVVTARLWDPDPHVQAAAIVAIRRTGFIRRPTARPSLEAFVPGSSWPTFVVDEATAALRGTPPLHDDTVITDVGELDAGAAAVTAPK